MLVCPPVTHDLDRLFGDLISRFDYPGPTPLERALLWLSAALIILMVALVGGAAFAGTLV